MKIYTRTGDDGTTGLFGGPRVRKDHTRIEAYGSVDETNAFIGHALAALPDAEWAARIRGLLARIQEELFVLGADLATPLDAKANVKRVPEAFVTAIERDIDGLEEDLAPLERFILPGGHPAAAALHVARTVCRRAERALIAATAEITINETTVHYLNRLSDLLFVAARWVNHMAGVPDVEWLPEKS